MIFEAVCASSMALCVGSGLTTEATSPRTPLACCECDVAVGKVTVACLDEKAMKTHIEHFEPLVPTGLDKGLRLKGVVLLEIRFQPDGGVSCVRGVSGHPIAISAALAAAPKWRLRATTTGGCGRIRVKYRFRDAGSSSWPAD